MSKMDVVAKITGWVSTIIVIALIATGIYAYMYVVNSPTIQLPTDITIIEQYNEDGDVVDVIYSREDWVPNIYKECLVVPSLENGLAKVFCEFESTYEYKTASFAVLKQI